MSMLEDAKHALTKLSSLRRRPRHHETPDAVAGAQAECTAPTRQSGRQRMVSMRWVTEYQKRGLPLLHGDVRIDGAQPLPPASIDCHVSACLAQHLLPTHPKQRATKSKVPCTEGMQARRNAEVTRAMLQNALWTC